MALNPAEALQKAMWDVLRADTQLQALLGGARIHDRPPRQAPVPFVTFGEWETHAWNTMSHDGHEHRITLHVWTEHGGRKRAYEIIARMDELLDDAALTLTDHHLVHIRSIFWTALRGAEGRLFHGLLRLRAVTHPLN